VTAVVADASPLIAFQQIGPPSAPPKPLHEPHRASGRGPGDRAERAAHKGLITAVRPSLDALVAQGFWVAPQLVKQMLVAAAEASEP
jgi:hypothetical protein